MDEEIKKRLNSELEDLNIKIKKLDLFINTNPIFDNLSVSEQYKLQLQQQTMIRYFNLLSSRVNNIFLNSLDYGQVIIAIKLGYCVARRNWNASNIFVCKQIESTISGEIIPKMQSLPKSSKNILSIYGIEPITYKNQMILINMVTKEVNSWVASSSDTFATDWYIYNPEN